MPIVREAAPVTWSMRKWLLTTPMMLRMRMLLILLATWRRRPRGDWTTAKLLVNQSAGGEGELTMKFHAIGDSSPPSWQKLAFVTYSNHATSSIIIPPPMTVETLDNNGWPDTYTYLHWEFLWRPDVCTALQCDCIWTSSWHAHFRPRRPAVLPLPRPLALAALEPLADLAFLRSIAIKRSGNIRDILRAFAKISKNQVSVASGSVRQWQARTCFHIPVTDCKALQCHMCHVRALGSDFPFALALACTLAVTLMLMWHLMHLILESALDQREEYSTTMHNQSRKMAFLAKNAFALTATSKWRFQNASGRWQSHKTIIENPTNSWSLAKWALVSLTPP